MTGLINLFSKLLLRDSSPISSKAAYSAIMATIVTAIILSSCYYSPEMAENFLESLSTEPVPVTQVIDSIITPPSTEEGIVEPALSPTLTEEEMIEGEDDESVIPSFDFAYERSRYGYFTYWWSNWRAEPTDSPQRVLTVSVPFFYYEGQKVTSRGHLIKGKFDYKGQETPLEIMIDSQHSKYMVGNTGLILESSADVSSHIRSGKAYSPDMFIVDNEGNPLLFSGSYTEEEWIEIRSQIDELLKNGGKTSELQLVLFNLWSY